MLKQTDPQCLFKEIREFGDKHENLDQRTLFTKSPSNSTSSSNIPSYIHSFRNDTILVFVKLFHKLSKRRCRIRSLNIHLRRDIKFPLGMMIQLIANDFTNPMKPNMIKIDKKINRTSQ